MSPGQSGEHPSRRERLLALLDLLSDEEQAKVDEHLASCESCRAWAELARDEIQRPDAMAHVPARVLARWDRVEPTLGPTERELINRHLDACSTCAEALMEVRRPLARPASQTADRRFLSAAAWSIGLATAAVLVFVLLPRVWNREPGTQVAMPPETDHVPADSAGTPRVPRDESTPPAPAERRVVVLALAPTGTPAQLELVAQLRDTADLPTILAAGAARTLRLRVPTITWFDPAHEVRVTLFSDRDSVFATRTVIQRSLNEQSVLAVTPAGPWSPGDYRIEVRDLTPPEPGLEPESVSFPFLIR